MDPIHHEKIVDKLMQYRGKIPKNGHLGDIKAQFTCDLMRNQIDDMIQLIEIFARQINMGMIQ